MEEQRTTCVLPETDEGANAKTSSAVSVDAYERMCATLYAYRFGTIGFLELLTRFEEILGIEPSQAPIQHAPDRKE